MRYFVAYFWVVTPFLVQAYKYKMEYDMFELLTRQCEKFPDHGVSAYLNVSNFSVKKENDNFLVDGSVTYIWNEREQFQRVEMRGVTERYQRGSWGPTTYNFVLPDFCKAIFDKTTPWYTAFFSHVKEEFRNCSYIQGYTMEFEPLTVKPMEMVIPGGDVTGTYRVFIYFTPYDTKNMKLLDSIYCFIVPLEVVRIS